MALSPKQMEDKYQRQLAARAVQEAQLRAQKAKARTALHASQERQRYARRVALGTLVDEAGLLDVDEAWLAGKLKLLADELTNLQAQQKGTTL